MQPTFGSAAFLPQHATPLQSAWIIFIGIFRLRHPPFQRLASLDPYSRRSCLLHAYGNIHVSMCCRKPFVGKILTIRGIAQRCGISIDIVSCLEMQWLLMFGCGWPCLRWGGQDEHFIGDAPSSTLVRTYHLLELKLRGDNVPASITQ